MGIQKKKYRQKSQTMYFKGALICLLALSIGIEAGKKKKMLKKLSKELGVPSSKLEDAIQTLVITKDIWFDAIRISIFSASGNSSTVTYDELRGNNNMNITNGIFSAPYSGVFEFFYQGRDYTGDWKYGQMQLLKNEEVMSYSVVDDEGGAHTLFGTAILNLVAGDQVRVDTLFDLYSISSN